MMSVSNAVNAAVAAIAAQVDRLAAKENLTAEEAEQLADLTRVLATIENNRTAAVVSLIAGRKNLDKLAPGSMDRLLKALADD